MKDKTKPVIQKPLKRAASRRVMQDFKHNIKGGVMKEWYRNIPPQGVLCKWVDAIVRIMSFDEDGILYDDNETDYVGSDFDFIKPLTAEEYWELAPWQDMDTAPRDGTKVIMKFISSKMFLIDSPRYSDIRDDVKWLPLPKVD